MKACFHVSKQVLLWHNIYSTHEVDLMGLVGLMPTTKNEIRGAAENYPEFKLGKIAITQRRTVAAAVFLYI